MDMACWHSQPAAQKGTKHTHLHMNSRVNVYECVCCCVCVCVCMCECIEIQNANVAAFQMNFTCKMFQQLKKVLPTFERAIKCLFECLTKTPKQFRWKTAICKHFQSIFQSILVEVHSQRTNWFSHIEFIMAYATDFWVSIGFRRFVKCLGSLFNLNAAQLCILQYTYTHHHSTDSLNLN